MALSILILYYTNESQMHWYKILQSLVTVVNANANCNEKSIADKI